MDGTLLLNSSFEPIKVISWEKAVTLFFLNKVEIVDVYERDVRSVTVAIKMPAVVRLLRYVKFHKKRPPLTRINLLARDQFQCQYCGEVLSYGEQTIDHVVPRSQGGTTHWENVVSACNGCNRKKGGQTPLQARMNLLAEPHEPDWLPVLTMRFKRNIPKPWISFLQIEEDA